MQIQHTKRWLFNTCLIFLSDNWEEDKQTWSGPQWRRCCGCGSSGRRLANTPWRSTHGHWSGSSRAGWPGRGVERHWSSRRSSSHSWGCSVNKTTVRLTEVSGPDSTYPFAGHLNTYLSTSSRVTMSFFFKALIAYSFPVFLNSASNTWMETPTTSPMRKTIRGGFDGSRWAPERCYLPKVSSAQNWDILVIVHLHPYEIQIKIRTQKWEKGLFFCSRY